MGGIAKGIGNAISGVGKTIFGAPDKLFGNNIPGELKNPRLTSFTSPGLGAQFLSPENLQVTRSPEQQFQLENISKAFRNQAQGLSNLRPLVEPGFGRLTEAGINAIRDARRASMGDLRQNLARRRVRGSSFGADDISRTAAEFARKENEFASQAFIQEMAMSQDLINQQAQASANAYLQTLSQANFESGLAAQLSSGVSGILSNNAQLMGQMSNSGASRLLNVLGTGAGAYLGTTQMPSFGMWSPNQNSGLNISGNTSYSPNFLSTNPWANPLVGGPRKL